MSAYTSWSVVFGEQPSAAKWNILGTNDASFNDGTGIGNGVIFPVHLATGLSSSTWAWQSWTPTWTNLTVGNGTQTAKYIQIGKTVHFRTKLVLGSASSVASNSYFDPPVTPNSEYGTILYTFGQIMVTDVSAGAYYPGFVGIDLTPNVSRFFPYVIVAGGTYGNPTGFGSTTPFTWATGDIIQTSGTYEAA